MSVSGVVLKYFSLFQNSSRVIIAYRFKLHEHLFRKGVQCAVTIQFLWAYLLVKNLLIATSFVWIVMLVLNAQRVHWFSMCVCVAFHLFIAFTFFSFAIHFHIEMRRYTGKWINNIWSFATCIHMEREKNALFFEFNWVSHECFAVPFIEALKMHRVQNTIFCVFSLATKWMIKMGK